MAGAVSGPEAEITDLCDERLGEHALLWSRCAHGDSAGGDGRSSSHGGSGSCCSGEHGSGSSGVDRCGSCG